MNNPFSTEAKRKLAQDAWRGRVEILDLRIEQNAPILREAAYQIRVLNRRVAELNADVFDGLPKTLELKIARTQLACARSTWLKVNDLLTKLEQQRTREYNAGAQLSELWQAA